VLCALVMSIAATACYGGGSTTYVVTPATGGLTLRWSIDGTVDPHACDAFFVANTRIDLYDVNGTPISTTFVDCRVFSAHFELAQGNYSARLEMTDTAGQPRSTSLPVAGIAIVSGTNLNIQTDFPRNSFF
jgi:hypothetical protein